MAYGEAAYGEVAYGSSPSGGGAGTTNETLTESLVLTDLSVADNEYADTLTEALSLLTVLTGKESTPVNDSFSFADVSIYDLAALLYDALAFNETYLIDATYNTIFADQVELSDAVYGLYAAAIADAFQLADTPSFVKAWTNKLVDALQLEDVADPELAVTELLGSALALADLAEHAYDGTLSDTIDLADVLGGMAVHYARVAESILANDTSAYGAMVTVGIEDETTWVDAIDNDAEFLPILEDMLTFTIWDGDTQSSYTGWVMNTAVGGLTEYKNYNFNSIAKIGGHYYGAADTGLYLLEGADDAGTDIDVRIKLGALDLGNGYKSRCEQAYIGVRTSGSIIFKVFTDDGKERWYESQAVYTELNTQRAKLGRGVKSRYWQFELINRDGADIELLEEIEFYPVALTRRV